MAGYNGTTWEDDFELSGVQEYISKVTLPDGKTYVIKDKAARETIQNIYDSVTKALHFVGFADENSLPGITDGSTTNVINLKDKDEPYTAQSGDVVIVTGEDGTGVEYVWDGTRWQRFGPTGTFGALAFKNSVEATGKLTFEWEDDGEASVNSTITVDNPIAVTIEATEENPTFDESGQDLSTKVTNGVFIPEGDVVMHLQDEEDYTAVKVIKEDGVAPTLVKKDSDSEGDGENVTTVLYEAKVNDETLSFSYATFTAGKAPTTTQISEFSFEGKKAKLEVTIPEQTITSTVELPDGKVSGTLTGDGITVTVNDED